MLFAYRKYRVTKTPIFPDGVLYRPEVLVHLTGPAGDVFVRGLVDTGADGTVFPRSIAESLGIDLHEAHTSSAAGFTGDQIDVIYAEVELEVTHREDRHRWRAIVGFVDYAQPEYEQTLLGRVGFLDQFRAAFDPEQNTLELTAI